jgi:arylsulfatase A-like enzyme
LPARLRPGLAALLLVALALGLGAVAWRGSARDGPRPPNLVLIVVDTLRADALDPAAGPDPGARTSMPFLAKLAREGTWFRQASSCSPWTMPALASLLTGLLPARHGLDDVRRPPALPASVPTFTERLVAHGYQAAAFVDTPWLGGPTSVGRGFGQFRRPFALAGHRDTVRPWLAARDRDRPFFLFLHTYEAHHPYGERNHPWPQVPERPEAATIRPEDFDEPWEFVRALLLERDAPARFRRDGVQIDSIVLPYMTTGYGETPRPALAEELRSAYVDGVRWVDASLAAMFEDLRAAGDLEDTVVVVTSDHGEAFGEHGLLGHGRSLDEELLRIPLVVWGPEPFRGGGVVDASVGLVDVMPTFLEAARIAPLEGVDGRSFLGAARGEAAGRPVLAKEVRCLENTGAAGDVLLVSARSEAWKYVLRHDVTRGTVREEAYDLRLDPGTRRNLAGAGGKPPEFDPAFCAAMERARDALWEAIEAGGRPHAGPAAGATPPRPLPCLLR